MTGPEPYAGKGTPTPTPGTPPAPTPRLMLHPRDNVGARYGHFGYHHEQDGTGDLGNIPSCKSEGCAAFILYPEAPTPHPEAIAGLAEGWRGDANMDRPWAVREKSCLHWDKPMTSREAARYLMCKGFVAEELYNKHYMDGKIQSAMGAEIRKAITAANPGESLSKILERFDFDYLAMLRHLLAPQPAAKEGEG